LSEGFVEYSETIGKVLANLQALEFSLRLYLHNSEDNVMAYAKPLHELTVGEGVPENPLTDWSSLGTLIGRYNSRVQPELAVDPAVVEVRDVLAHGRMWLPHLGASPVLLKFAKPSSGSTRVTFLQVSSSEWLAAMIRQVHIEIEKVQTALGGVVAGHPTSGCS
jgi:hypothetical protein